MGKVPKYEILEQKTVQRSAEQKKASEKTAKLLRGHNLSPLALLNEIIKDQTYPTPLVKNGACWEKIKGFSKEKLLFLKVIFEKSDTFINSIDNINAISNIFSDYHSSYGYAIRKIEDWVPKRRHHTKQIKELIDFLFGNYKVPEFLYKFFSQTVGTNSGRLLYYHITNGRSFKKFKYAPSRLKYNNKAYHYLFSTPESYNYFEAFRRAQILSMGGSESLVKAFMRSKLRDEETARNDEFWVTVIHAFIDAPMFNLDKIAEIIDYIDAQKYQRAMMFGEERIPMPNFSMKGRTPQTLLKKAEAWHREMAHGRRVTRANEVAARQLYVPRPIIDEKWKPQPIENYTQTVIKADPTTGIKYTVTYVIKQLTSTKQLQEEGGEMRNCVYSYSSACASGSSAIFSMQSSGKLGERLLTIQVKGTEIVQVRGRRNGRLASGHSFTAILKKWADKEGLKIINSAL